MTRQAEKVNQFLTQRQARQDKEENESVNNPADLDVQSKWCRDFGFAYIEHDGSMSTGIHLNF